MADDPAAQVMALREGRLDKPARYSHRFIGANHVMTDTSLGDTLSVLRGGLLPGVDRDLNQATLAEQARQTTEFLRTAAGLELRGTTATAEGLHVELAVQNLGAGHNLPTGVNDQKHMWLEIHLTDATGAEIFRSGGDAERLGVEDPQAVAWLEHFLDNKGQRITGHLTFATARVEWVRKPIPPRGEELVGYDIPLPPDAQGPFRLTAQLHYRVALPDLIYQNLRRTLPVPSFTLAELSADLPEQAR